MRTSRFTDEQMIGVLREVAGGAKVQAASGAAAFTMQVHCAAPCYSRSRVAGATGCSAARIWRASSTRGVIRESKQSCSVPCAVASGACQDTGVGRRTCASPAPLSVCPESPGQRAICSGLSVQGQRVVLQQSA
jgi:hypothetical protein